MDDGWLLNIALTMENGVVVMIGDLGWMMFDAVVVCCHVVVVVVHV